jgi:hypothetical protein
VRADEARIRCLQLRVGQADLRRHIAAQVVEQRVCARDQIAEHRRPLGMLQVQRDALLVAVEGMEKLAVLGREEMRPDPPADVAAIARILDLDHLCAEVGEVERAPGSGAVLLDGEHAQALERRAAGGLVCSHQITPSRASLSISAAA